MYRIKYQVYGNDLCRTTNLSKYFNSLEEINDWIVQNYYYQEYYCMGEKNHSHIGYYGDRISFSSKTLNIYFSGFNFVKVWIELIESGDGILYSNGEHTQGIRHISKQIEEKFVEWRKEDKEDPKHLKRLGFNFI